MIDVLHESKNPSFWNYNFFFFFLDETGPDTEVIEGDYISLLEQPDSDIKITCNKYRSGYGSVSWYKDG